jgi:hypothetical protein
MAMICLQKGSGSETHENSFAIRRTGYFAVQHTGVFNIAVCIVVVPGADACSGYQHGGMCCEQ